MANKQPLLIPLLAIGIVVAGTSAFAQRPSDPALLVPQTAPALDYVAVANPLPVPAGTNMGAAASVAFDSKGHLFVLSRGAQPLTEFDGDGKFIRFFGEGLFTRSHGLRIDAAGNIWATDVGASRGLGRGRRGRRGLLSRKRQNKRHTKQKGAYRFFHGQPPRPLSGNVWPKIIAQPGNIE